MLVPGGESRRREVVGGWKEEKDREFEYDFVGVKLMGATTSSFF